jgi:hypothetical protein
MERQANNSVLGTWMNKSIQQAWLEADLAMVKNVAEISWCPSKFLKDEEDTTTLDGH